MYKSTGDLDNALVQHQKDLEIRASVFGSEHLDVARSFGNIGVAYEEKNDLENALVHKQKGLEIMLKLLGSEHPLVADSLKNLGIVYGKKGNRAAKTEMNTKAYRLKPFINE
jgi:hypothetical protein